MLVRAEPGLGGGQVGSPAVGVRTRSQPAGGNTPCAGSRVSRRCSPCASGRRSSWPPTRRWPHRKLLGVADRREPGAPVIAEFNTAGMDSLRPPTGAGHPRRIDDDTGEAIRAIALARPCDLGEPGTRWSLSRRRYLIRHRVLRSISKEHLRRLLNKMGITASGPVPGSGPTTPSMNRRSSGCWGPTKQPRPAPSTGCWSASTSADPSPSAPGPGLVRREAPGPPAGHLGARIGVGDRIVTRHDASPKRSTILDLAVRWRTSERVNP